MSESTESSARPVARAIGTDANSGLQHQRAARRPRRQVGGRRGAGERDHHATRPPGRAPLPPCCATCCLDAAAGRGSAARGRDHAWCPAPGARSAPTKIRQRTVRSAAVSTLGSTARCVPELRSMAASRWLTCLGRFGAPLAAAWLSNSPSSSGQPFRHVRAQLCRCRARLFQHNLGQHRHRVAGDQRRAARQAAEQQAAEAVQSRCARSDVAFTAHLLGRHVGRGADGHAGLRQVAAVVRSRARCQSPTA